MVQFARYVFVVALGLLAACTAEPGSRLSLVEATIADIQDAITSGEASCVDVVNGYIDRIREYDQVRGINAITVINPKAVEKAREADRALQNGDTLPKLFCAPLLIKDNFDRFFFFFCIQTFEIL